MASIRSLIICNCHSGNNSKVIIIIGIHIYIVYFVAIIRVCIYGVYVYVIRIVSFTVEEGGGVNKTEDRLTAISINIIVRRTTMYVRARGERKKTSLKVARSP